MRTRLPHLPKPAAGLLLASAAVAMSIAAVAYAGPLSEPAGPTPVARGVALDPLNNPTVYARLPADKQAFLDRENELRKRALEHPLSLGIPPSASTDYRVTPRAADADPLKIRAGNGTFVASACGMMYRDPALEFTNTWVADPVDGRSAQICAGARDGRPGLHVMFWNAEKTSLLPAPSQLQSPWLRVPAEASGSLKIVGALGNTLELQLSSGRTLYFDVSTLSYVDSPKPEATTGPR